MRNSYLDYAMSVIVGRALPDVRDGLKPVHRRTLFAMREAGNYHNKPYKKSARIVGDVLGKFHPHSGEAVYDALVRLAQDFSMGLPLVDGQGNFGSIDGDNAAAMRYTEVRLDKISEYLLADIEKETVDFIPNYDGAEVEPTCLPSRFPNLLVNGSTGIAVGMATNIPPHNLGEAIDCCLLMLKNPEASIDDIIKIMPAPDFPTRGIISNLSGVRDAYTTGRGRILMRARTHFESLENKNAQPSPVPIQGGGKQAIVVDELPYQVNKATLISHIAELVREKKIEGITDLRDESDRAGIRIMIELKRNENAQIILNNLFKETALQENFSINMVCLDNGSPKLLGVRDIINRFLRHRREIVVRRTEYELRKAQAKAHLLEGQAVAVDNVDEIVNLIKSSPTPADAEKELLERVWKSPTVNAMLARLPHPDAARPEEADPSKGMLKDGYHFSEAQVKSILDLRLARLTALERDKIAADYSSVVDEILACLSLLASAEKIDKVIGDELTEVKNLFNTPRRSEIADIEINTKVQEIENLIADEEMVVTFSHRGYLKREPSQGYKPSPAGGRENDFVRQLFVASTHDDLLMFTNRGRVYCKKVHELQLVNGAGRGQPLVGMVELQQGEAVQTVLSVSAADRKNKNNGIMFATAKGLVKRSELAIFDNIRNSGIIALDLKDGDKLVATSLVGSSAKVLLFSDSGKAICFDAKTVRSMGRSAAGIRGMKFKDANERVAAMVVVAKGEDSPLLIMTDKGRGKKIHTQDFAVKGRGGQGVIALVLKTKNAGAKIVGVVSAAADDRFMLVTNKGDLWLMTMTQVNRQNQRALGIDIKTMTGEQKLVGAFKVARVANKK